MTWRRSSPTQMNESRLATVEHELRRRFGASIQLEQVGSTPVIGAGEDAILHVTLDDADKPSFILSYPCFGSDAHSHRDVEDRTVHGVLLQAIVGIVGAVLTHGAVLPEFPSAALRRSLKRWSRRHPRP